MFGSWWLLEIVTVCVCCKDQHPAPPSPPSAGDAGPVYRLGSLTTVGPLRGWMPLQTVAGLHILHFSNSKVAMQVAEGTGIILSG